MKTKVQVLTGRGFADLSTIETPANTCTALALVPPTPSTHPRFAPTYSSALDLADRLVNDPTTSRWLATAVVQSMGRDLVDAAADCELLLSVVMARLEEIQGGAS